MHEIAPDDGPNSDGEGGVDTSLRDPGLELGDRERGVLAPREVEETLLRHQLVERRLAARELRRRLAVARSRVLALVTAARGAALRRALATTETGVLRLAWSKQMTKLAKEERTEDDGNTGREAMKGKRGFRFKRGVD